MLTTLDFSHVSIQDIDKQLQKTTYKDADCELDISLKGKRPKEVFNIYTCLIGSATYWPDDTVVSVPLFDYLSEEDLTALTFKFMDKLYENYGRWLPGEDSPLANYTF